MNSSPYRSTMCNHHYDHATIREAYFCAGESLKPAGPLGPTGSGRGFSIIRTDGRPLSREEAAQVARARDAFNRSRI